MRHSQKELSKQDIGRKGEELVVKFLRKRRYRIVVRNYTTPFGEADIVARSREGTYCFIEVKSRESDAFGDPTEAVTEEKRRRYRAIALFFCSTIGEEPVCRFDVAAVRGGEIEYIENAF